MVAYRPTTSMLLVSLLLAPVCVLVCLPCGLAQAHGDGPVRYDGHQLWRITPQSQVELEAVDFLANKHNLSFWQYPSTLGRPVDVLVSPGSVNELISFFKRSFLKFEILQTDIQRLIDEQFADRPLPGAEFAYHKYHTLAEINEWMDLMVKNHGDLVSKREIGKSYEGRTIYILKITTGADKYHNGSASGKQAIFIEGGIHAREWISPATVVYMTNQLLKQYDSSSEVKQILDGIDWYILPVFNVDGYEYTWTTNRMWRKTRSRTRNPLCPGVDPNRNWDNNWCGAGSSRNPCSELYCGPKPFSEVEVEAVANFLQSGINFRGFIDFHSYSQLWMTPYGWTTDLPKDYSKQIAQAEQSVKALTAVFGTSYVYGTIASTLYVASGSSIDYVYDNLGVVYSTTVELRDQGQRGFILPDSEIIPSGEETFEGLKQYALYMLNN
ncbi:carboxypeptidase B-like [Diadema antillarum]|uniref:carboxypeptidase B-like n=1 Tax=Diadema antillarum TaxID=105358 RepID=UPI003A8A1135